MGYDNVNHPAYYCRPGQRECIDEMLYRFGVEKVKAFCLLNVFKYHFRADMKNGQEDLDKANWYQRKFLELGGTDAELVKGTLNIL